MKHLRNKEPRCIILTSGTMEPLAEVETEMEIPSPIILQNPHIIDQSQVYVKIVSKGTDGIEFDSSYCNR